MVLIRSKQYVDKSFLLIDFWIRPPSSYKRKAWWYKKKEKMIGECLKALQKTMRKDCTYQIEILQFYDIIVVAYHYQIRVKTI